MNKLYTLAVVVFFSYQSNSQNVKVGATATAPNASAMLDIDGITGLTQAKGMLIPRVTDAQRTLMNPLPAAAQGLLVYQTNTAGTSLEGFYYNISTTTVPNWVYLVTDKTSWLLTGNAGTTAGTNFIGTTDSQDFIFKSAGNAAANERMRISKDGNISINNAGYQAGDVFSVYGNGTTTGTVANTSALGSFAINGYSNSGLGAGAGIYGEQAGAGIAIWGNSTGYGVYGATNANGTSPGVYGENYNASTALPINVSAYGVYGTNNRVPSGTGSSIGVVGRVDATVTAGTAVGVYGFSASITGYGMRAYNQNVSGTGLLTSGQNVAGTFLTAGSGGAFTGSTTGGFGYGTAVSNGTGLVGGGNAGGITTLTSGSGVAGTGVAIGVAGFSTSTAAINRGGGYFSSNAGTSYAYVGGITLLGVNRKIEGNGTVNTTVKDTQGNNVVLSAPEAPENLFQDYGTGQLINGKALITLDPIFSKNIIVNEQHPLRVFIQLRDDCKGVYVTHETASGFEVKELQNGNSSARFYWTVTANRADEINPDGTVSKYSAERFAPAMGAAPAVNQQIINNTTGNIEVAEPAIKK